MHQTPPSRRPPSARVLARSTPIKVRPDSTLGFSLALEAEEEPALFAVRSPDHQPQPAVGLQRRGGGLKPDSTNPPPAVAQHGRPGALHGDLLPVSGRNDALALCFPPPGAGRPRPTARARGGAGALHRGRHHRWGTWRPSRGGSVLWSSATRDDGTGWSRVRRRGGGETGLAPDRPLPGGARAGIETGAARSTEPPSR